MVDFDALRERVGVAVQSSLDILEGLVEDLRMDADTLVDKVFDKIEEIVEQAQPAAPQEREENSDSTRPNWKMQEPYVAPKTGGRTREDSQRIETMYNSIVEYGATHSKMVVGAYPLDYWLNNPEKDSLLEMYFASTLIYNGGYNEQDNK